MIAPSMIAAVGVVVPARDEEDVIARCLHSVLAALPPAIDTAVCVVLDRCTDRTAARVPASVQVVTNRRPATVGELRDRGVRRLLRRLAGHPPERIWLLSTDADSIVGPTWVADHLRHAAAGAHAVAGLADLDDAGHLTPSARLAYARILGAGTRGDGHAHVYAANLGIRADTFESVGGFPLVPHGEDHGLAARVRGGGYRMVTALDGRVRTSARTLGRSSGGLASLLGGL